MYCCCSSLRVMAAEASTAGLIASCSHIVGSKSGPLDASECQCTRCGRTVFVASGHHRELQCGHAFCEQCLLVTQEYTSSNCPDCEGHTIVSKNQGHYSIVKKEDSSLEALQHKTVKNWSSDIKKTVDQLIVDLEHSSSIHRTVSSPSAIMLETEEIDGALKIAGYNFEQLSNAIKVSILNNSTRR
ncbi:RING finger protein 17-like [Mesocricetus auratus]|uniref:RING finger protein 17-like n=1 Tax=Mesocricetus auratus TaxID=10036 RepID=A0ABM2WZQ5_MESAU|nr:RING finger protein 17-like [Mesocricetus auratus]